MQLVTVPYVVDHLTHSTAWVGVAAFCTLFPIVPMALVGGTWADRYSRRAVVLSGQLTMLVPAVALYVLSATGTTQLGLLLALVTLYSAGNGIVNVSNTPFVSEIVEPRQFTAALRLMFTQVFASRATGPAVGGLVLASSGPTLAFFLNAVSFLPLIVVVARSPRRPGASIGDGGVWTQVRSAVLHVQAQPGLRLGLLMFLALGLLAVSMTQLIEPFARHVLHRSTADYGLLVTSYGLGALVGSLLHVAIGERSKASALVAGGFVASALSLIVIGLLGYEVALVALFVFGFATVVVSMSLLLACQSKTDDAHRGRVVGLMNVGYNGGVPIGALTGGLFGDVLGLRAVLVGAALAIVGVLAVARRSTGFEPLNTSAFEDGGLESAEHGPLPPS